MIDRDWAPKNLGDIKGQEEKLKLQIRPDLTTDEANRMQLEVLLFATNLTFHISNARWYESKMLREYRHTQTKAYLAAEGTDRKRDSESKNSPETRVAEALFYEAETYRKLLEDLKADFVALHYALKATLKDKTDERKWGG